MHAEKIGGVLTKAQAEYVGVPPEGSYKPEHYRY
ncbi:MAG: adenosylhomocysteinase [Verrucomicrobia bacterium]|nr:adenosylhomocysteinase [Verrucomicrobiota bacterium]